MDTSRDASVLRSLAVAFGDGLAFGVGMKLTQSAAGKAGAPAPSDVGARLERLERRLEQIGQNPAAVAPATDLEPGVLDALAHALEARLQEQAGFLERRVAELEMRLAVELKALRQQDQALAAGAETQAGEMERRLDEQVLALRKKVNEDRNALQNQVVALHREFAAAVADIVEEQVANQVEQRLAEAVSAQLGPLEERLREEMRQAAADKNGEIRDLRQRVAENDRNVLDVLLNVGELFRQAAGRLGAPAAAQEEPPTAAEMPAPPEAPVVEARAAVESENLPPRSPDTPEAANLLQESDLPGFAQTRQASAAWSVPLVSSFVITAACVLALQYL